jgi:signal transduction histidine kinase
MISLLDFVPTSSSNILSEPVVQFSESDKRQLEQLLNQGILNLASWQNENQAASKQANATEDSSKMDKLQEELEALKFFGAGIAHDLGNVLTVILGNLELAKLYQMSALGQSGFRQTLDDIEGAANMAKALHTQLHQLFQGKTLAKEKVALEELLKGATYLGLYGSRVECQFKLSNPLPMVQVDRCQISEVIENLVLNAVQAMPGGGQIQVGALAVELAEGQVQGLKAGQYIEIMVSDTGPGIAPEHLSMIFAPHFTTKEKGQGLGLALCYSIIKRHQGHIGVESQPGAGTTFRFWLPIN